MALLASDVLFGSCCPKEQEECSFVLVHGKWKGNQLQGRS